MYPIITSITANTTDKPRCSSYRIISDIEYVMEMSDTWAIARGENLDNNDNIEEN